MKNLFLPLLLLLTFFVSCTNEENEEIEKNMQSFDVYVAGRENNEACYWKNTVKTILPSGANYTTNNIFVDNNDIYVAGYNITLPYLNYVFWKNNVKYDITSYLGIQPNTPTTTKFTMSDFFVINGDLYIAGMMLNPSTTSTQNLYQYCYWKNGVKTVVFEQSDYQTSARLLLIGNDIYIPLEKNITTSPNAPTTWDLGYYKNGSYHFVTTLSNCLDIFEINGSIKMLILDYNSNNVYYRDLLNNSVSPSPSFITATNHYYNHYVDGLDEYFIIGPYYYKNSTQQNLYSNGSNFKFLDDFKPMDGNIYKILHTDDNTGVNFNVYANNTIIMASTNGSNSVNTEFNKLAVVPN